MRELRMKNWETNSGEQSSRAASLKSQFASLQLGCEMASNYDHRQAEEIEMTPFPSLRGPFNRAIRMPPLEYRPRLKVAVVGAPCVGKTTIVKAMCALMPPRRHVPTEEEDVYVLQHEAEPELVLVHDMGGHVNEYQADNFLAGANAVVLVYDYSRYQETIQVLSDVWMPRIRRRVSPDAGFFLVANNDHYNVSEEPSWPFDIREEALYNRLPRKTRENMHFFTKDSVLIHADKLATRLYLSAKRSYYEREAEFCNKTREDSKCHIL